MSPLRALPLLSLLILPLSAATITQWNFDASAVSPSTGSGTANLVGGTTATFAAGNGGGFAWNTTTYAAQSAGSGTRGVEFFASTAGYENITISYDHRASGTGSRWAQIEYTVNGGTSWTVAQNNGGGISPHDTFYSFSFDLSAITAVDNVAGFGVRITSIFAPVAFDQNATLGDFAADSAYQRANAQSGFDPGSGVGTGDYGAAGTWRFDNFTISGTAVPEPSAALLGAVGVLGLLRRRRASLK
jgi:hypothetical protein